MSDAGASGASGAGGAEAGGAGGVEAGGSGAAAAPVPAASEGAGGVGGSGGSATAPRSTPADARAWQQRPAAAAEEDEEDEPFDDYDLADSARAINAIVQPVSLCMLVVVWVITTIFQDTSAFSGIMVYDESQHEDDSSGKKAGGALLNALFMLALIVVATVLLVLLYKWRCYKVIYGWLLLTVTFMLFFFGGLLWLQLWTLWNLPLDTITYYFVLANVSVAGSLAVFWHAPPKATQATLVFISVLMAAQFARLPEWTTWFILAIIALYDIVAVLSPKGPLKTLVETSRERNEPIPGLVYSAGGCLYMSAVSDIKLGLGDFSVVICVLGTIVMLGWRLEIPESVSITVLVGLSVDYVVHLAHAYNVCPYTTRYQRVQAALTELGVSVVAGAVTTMSATVFLFPATLLLLSRFGVIVCVAVLFSLAFSMLAFMSLLVLFGPTRSQGNIGHMWKRFRGQPPAADDHSDAIELERTTTA